MIPCAVDHAAIKFSPAWNGLAFLGTQRIPSTNTRGARDYELRNCACGSTLAKVVVTGGAQ